MDSNELIFFGQLICYINRNDAKDSGSQKGTFRGAFVRIAKMLRDYAIAVLVLQCMIYIGFEKGIKTIYWCVSPQNQRAVKFYDKNGYQRNDMCKTLAKKYYDIDEINRYIWYVVEKQ